MVVNISKVLSGDWDYVRQDIAAVVEVTHARRAEGQGHLRELLPERRAEDPPLRDLRRTERRLGEDLDRLRSGRGDHRRPDPDAQALARTCAGEGRRRRSRSRPAARSPRPRRQPRGRHAHRRDARRMPPPAWTSGTCGRLCRRPRRILTAYDDPRVRQRHSARSLARGGRRLRQSGTASPASS